MKVAKQAVMYYTMITGNDWSEFYNKLDMAMSTENPTGELFIIKRLMETIIESGLSINDFKMNKDAVKAVFDDDSRKKNGEFFTPIIWAKELYTYIDKFIPNWRQDHYIWENSCYSMDTELLTKRGWVTYDELLDDDYIYSLNPETLKAEWVRFHNRFKKFYDGDAAEFKGLGIDLLVTADHKMFCGKKNGISEDIEYKDITAEDLYNLYKDKGYEYRPYTVITGAKIDEECVNSSDIDFENFLNIVINIIISSNSVSTGSLSEHIGGCEYCTDSIADRDKVALLAIYLGYSVKYLERELENGSMEYCVSVSNKSCISLGSDNITVLPYKDYVWDITLDKNHVFLVRRNGVPVFSKNCGSGNLLRESKAKMTNVYMSSLQDDDITLVMNTPEFEGVNAFQCDFLEGIDYDIYNTEFLDKLPPRLKEIIVNDEPLLIICNPPYKSGSGKATDVGRYMHEIGLGKPAYDIFYQFCWRVMRFVEMFNLKNCYFSFFGPLTFFTGSGANILLREFEHCFEFLDGMCISAQEFSDTSESILWGISGSVWKSRGGYQPDRNHKDILLEKKFILPDGTIGCEGRVLYEPPRQKLSDWVAPKDVIYYNNAPLMTSHLTFKGSEVFEKVAPKSGKLADNALGTLMVGNTLTRSADQSAILSMPSTIQYVSITEENFWRCVSSYAFRRTVDAGWAIAKKEISAPNTNVEGYDLWLKNALVLFLFEYKSMMSSLRGVSWGGDNNYVIRNKFFYLTEEEIREHCHDEVILADLDKYPLENQFILERIKECEPYWSPEIRALYDWCKSYTLFSYDKRKEVGYKGSLDCADAGFQQIRSGGVWNDRLSDELTKLLVQARDYMRKDLDKFGFVSETEDEDL